MYFCVPFHVTKISVCFLGGGMINKISTRLTEVKVFIDEVLSSSQKR